MYTQCPDCLTVYMLEAELLVPACGCLRCDHCGAVFNALGTLAAQLPPGPFVRLPHHALDREPPLATSAVFRPREPAPVPGPVPKAATSPPAPGNQPYMLWHDTSADNDADIGTREPHGDVPQDDPIDDAGTHPMGTSDSPARAGDDEDFSQLTFTPRFARPRRRSWQTAALVSVCVILLLGLGMQLAWAKRDSLVREPTVGRAWASACDILGCHVPLAASPAQLRLMARNVEQHPTVRDGLLITASVRNDASFGQPYPTVVITLSDAGGQRLAMRRFLPGDYVGDPAVRARGLPGGATTAMVFEVQDPGQQAVGFAFSFE